MPYTIKYNGKENTFTDKSEFDDTCDLLDERGIEYETETPETDGGDPTTVTPEPVDKEVESEDNFGDELSEAAEGARNLISHPISYLRGINDKFVNTIKGKPSISKRGFRYMQTELGISTEAEVVETFDDPKGVIVWAKAEMPDGRSAEAHGEGYLSESDVADNEWVRYADTRAKNRAISDLTSSGALSESEL
jgi:hypothetical protein